jgi:hypothetical protein
MAGTATRWEGTTVDSTRQKLIEDLDALRKATNQQVAEREGRPGQLDLLAEGQVSH